MNFPDAYNLLNTFCTEHNYELVFERDTWDGKEIAQCEIDGQDDDDYIFLLDEDGNISMTEFNLDGVSEQFEADIHELRNLMFERFGSTSVKDAFIAAITNDLPHPTKGM